MKNLILVSILLGLMLVACSSDDSKQTYDLLDDTLPAGSYAYMWDQFDGDENVPTGSYAIHMRAGDFEDAINFQILASNDPVQPACDSSGNTGGGVLPAQFALDIDTTDYAPGDTICIYFDLPTMADVRLYIRER